MQIAVGAADVKLVIGDAPQPVGDGRHAGGELAAVAHHDAVARQPVGVLGDVLFQALAAHLLLALDNELQIDRQPALDGDPGLGAFQVGEHLAFVVGGPPGVEVAVAAAWLEGGGDPFFQRIGRLHVVVAVDQGRRGVRHGRRLGVHQRMPRRRDHLGGKPEAAELVGHPLRRPVHVVAAGRVGADAGNPQEFAQFLLEPGGMRLDVLVDGGHGTR